MRGVICVLLIGSVMLCGCAGPRSYRSKVTARKPGKKERLLDLKEQEKVKNYITVIGMGVADKELKGTQRRASAREAAIAMAQYQLAGVIKGMKIKGVVTVEKAAEKYSRIEASVNELLKGARVVKTEWLVDGGCLITLRLDFVGTLAERLGIDEDFDY